MSRPFVCDLPDLDIKYPADAKLMTREDSLETFLDAVRELRPKYAVPFASMVAFLHPESRHCNVYAVRPPEVAAAAAASDIAATTETVLMVPGDTWSAEGGFRSSPTTTTPCRMVDRTPCRSVGRRSSKDDEERGN
jgi:hypothetical protein